MPLERLAKAIHVLFFATEEAAARHEALRASLTNDDELAAFQSLDVALINFEPIPEADLERARAKFEAREVEEAERIARRPASRVTIEVNENSPEALYFKGLLERMYGCWEGTLDYERGRHRLCMFSQLDDQGRRHSCFASVLVDGKGSDVRARTYVLGPYLLAEDYRTGRKTDDPWKVLHGDLSALLPDEESA